jgi:phosphopantothenoylcysteine synthetase/decarboxylase
VHAAAVSDFSVREVEVAGAMSAPGQVKLRSDSTPILHLQRNPKLLDTLRARSRNPAVKVVAFKLTQGASAAEAQGAIRALFASGVADFVVHNDLASRTESGAFPAQVWGSGEQPIARCDDRSAIAPALESALLGAVPASR